MRWGTYRPGVYFGVKGRHAGSLFLGLAWGSRNGKVLRHNCQSGELQRFGWLEHDGASYGRQVLEDKGLNLRLETTFVKDPERPHEAWHTRVRVTPLAAVANISTAAPVSVYLYLGVESGGGLVALADPAFSGDWEVGADGAQTKRLRLHGRDPAMGPFGVAVDARMGGSAEAPPHRVRYVSAALPPESQETVEQSQTGVWNAPEHLLRFWRLQRKNEGAGKGALLPDAVYGDADRTNWWAMQVVYQFAGELQVDSHVDFASGGPGGPPGGADLAGLAAEGSAAFRQKIAKVFPLVHPFTTDRHREVAGAAVANLLGGLGDFRGRLLVRDADGDLERSSDEVLFSTVPSRSFFPRGFLWDEGFHGLLVVRWQPRVFLDIVDHWLGLQRESGWIPREVPLGAEQEARVPFSFLPQEPSVANPPSLLLPLAWLAKTVLIGGEPQEVVEQLAQSARLSSVSELRQLVLAFAGRALPRLAAWFRFLLRTQKSERPGCFRWAGRTAAHCLASGLDDYPRGLLVNSDECHLDLHSWVTFFAHMLDGLCRQVAGSGHLPPELEKSVCVAPNWSRRARELNASLFEIFAPKKVHPGSELLADYISKQPVTQKGEVLVTPPWRSDGRCGPEFPMLVGGRRSAGECDPYGGGPCCSPSGWCGGSPEFCECPGCRRALKLEDRKTGQWSTENHSPHVGYVSLFPLLLGLLPATNPRLAPLLEALDPERKAGLSTLHGIPSLSTKDPLFGQGENYWRGKLWANINYLAVSALERVATTSVDSNNSQRARRMHPVIRERFVGSVVEAYHKQGYLFENFDPVTGEGRGAAPFTGWTTSVVLLMAGQGLGPQLLGHSAGGSSEL